MKTIRLALSLVAVCLLACGCASTSNNKPTAAVSFEWHNRLQLTREQEKLLHLYNKVNHMDPELARHQPDIANARTKLGRDAVRPARPDELIMFRENQADHFTIFNPSDDNVAFTVSIKGDEDWMGSLKGSIGRETYLPPKGALNVTNLYWTTPRMARRD